MLSYTWPGGPQRLAQDLTRVAQAAEDNGFDTLSVMDHRWSAPAPAHPHRRRGRKEDPADTSGLAGLHLQGAFQPVITSSTTAEGTYSVQFHFGS